jgi:hypothetical protein
LREPDPDPFFAIIGRDGAQIFIKSYKDVAPLPNSKRHRFMRLDAFVYASDPDALAADFADHDAPFSVLFKIPTTVFAASRFAILTATFCSLGGQGRGGVAMQRSDECRP